jgi:DNA-binding transcriptional MerR regulator
LSEAGYRLYGTGELERLQQILLYRELDFTLEQIKVLLEGECGRLALLSNQKELLLVRKTRLEKIIDTISKTISFMEKGERLEDKELFLGFETEEEWHTALKDHNEHLKATYGFDLLDSTQMDIQSMNDMAAEAAAFMTGMANALRAGIKHDDENIFRLIGTHLDFLNKHGHSISAADFVSQTRFFLDDGFHLRMLEDQQTGLAYYLHAAADSYALKQR